MIALLLGCAGDETEVRTPSAVPPLVVDGPVWTAPVLEVRAEVPPRFTATLATPSPSEEGGPDRHPPVGLVQHGLCAGDGPWRAQLSSSVRAQAAEERWRFWELTTLSGCASPAWCAWLAGEAVALGAEGTPYWIGLTTCDDDATAALVEESAPDDLYVQWALAHPGPFRPRLAQIAERAAGDVDRQLAVLAALRQTDGPEAEQALLDLHRRAAPADRERVAMHLGGRDDARARRLHRDACGGAATPACTWERPDPLRDLPRALQLGVDADALLERYPNHRTALLSGFERCLLEQAFTVPPIAVACARALATADRGAARAALALVTGADSDLDALRVALETPDLAERLRGLGFAIPADLGPAGPSALDLLAAAGLTVSLDEVAGWPPRHERLLYDLATAAGLSDVSFDELVPSEQAPAVPGRIPRIALFAWLDGVRLRTLVDDARGTWDPPRAVGLVNAVLARRGADGRFAIDERERRAIFGPPAALEALAEQGFVTWAVPLDPAASP